MKKRTCCVPEMPIRCPRSLFSPKQQTNIQANRESTSTRDLLKDAPLKGLKEGKNEASSNIQTRNLLAPVRGFVCCVTTAAVQNVSNLGPNGMANVKENVKSVNIFFRVMSRILMPRIVNI